MASLLMVYLTQSKCNMGNFYNSSYSAPQEWREAFVALVEISKPKVISRAKWLDIHYNAITLFKKDNNMLKAIIENNWTLNDIFGCHYLAPMTRFDCMGLFLLKKQQERILNVDEDRIQLKTKNNIIKSFYRSFYTDEQVLLYDL